jgi:FkbM family methyltransferase
MLRRRPRIQIVVVLLSIFFLITIYLNNFSTTDPVPEVKRTNTTSTFTTTPSDNNLMKLLRDTKIEYIVTKTKTDPPFFFAGPSTQPILEFMRKNGMWAPFKVQILRNICLDRCNTSRSTKDNPLVIDVGGNVGQVALYTAAMGCNVKTYEPGHDAFHFLKLGVYLNGFERNVELNERAVDAGPGEVVISVKSDWGITVINHKMSVAEFKKMDKTEEYVTLKSVALFEEIKSDVLVLKIDVEGSEDNVIKGLIPVIGKYDIENIIMETKKMRDYSYKLDFINSMSNNYLILSYREDYSLQGVEKDFENIDCLVVKDLRHDEWIPFEDLWFIKIGSPSFEKAVKNLNCLK